MRCVIIDATGTVVNCVVIDPNLPPEEKWQPPEGHIVAEHAEAGPGWKIGSDGKLYDPNPYIGALPATEVKPGEGMAVV